MDETRHSSPAAAEHHSPEHPPELPQRPLSPQRGGSSGVRVLPGADGHFPAAAEHHPPEHPPELPQRPLSPQRGSSSVRADGPFPAAPNSRSAAETPRVSIQDHATHEEDIADSGSGAHLLEKRLPVSPTSVDKDRSNMNEKRQSADQEPAIDWIVPVSSPEKRGTVAERLQATLDVAKEEQAKYAKRAERASMGVNGAMFAQIIINALITGLSAANGGRNTQNGVAALGALGTIIASFLVRVRGTREPERSVTHSQKLEKFIRELEAFILDEGGSRDRKWDARIKSFREEFDKLQTAVHQSENGQPTQQV